MSDRVLYAAHGIDGWIYDTFFSNTEKGYFVDIGAHHPTRGNNTYFFEQLGWEGICFEPLPELAAQLSLERKCTVVKKALSDTPGVFSFFQIKGVSEVLSGLEDKFDQTSIARINKEIEEHNQDYDYIEVECSLFEDEVTTTEIDLLSIDVEGAELDILKTIDFDKYFIKVMIVEFNHPNPPLLSFIEEKEFSVVARKGVDIIFKNNSYVY